MRTNKLALKNQIKDYKKAIAMKCLDCVNCQPTEILRCQITGCPLWNFRPKNMKGLYTLIKVLKKNNPSFYEARN